MDDDREDYSPMRDRLVGSAMRDVIAESPPWESPGNDVTSRPPSGSPASISTSLPNSASSLRSGTISVPRSAGSERFSGFVKKVRMGKRIEKAFGRQQVASSATADSHDDDPNKTPEPHICTGHFQTDFTELCRRNHMAVIPPVVMRPRRPQSPSQAPPPEEKTKPGKKDPKANQPPPEPEPEVALDENGEPQEPPPKTYTTKDKFEFFKPTVQVEMDVPEKQETVTEVHVRGWKVDEPMMGVFKQCWPKMDRLHSINLWHTGLSEDTVEMLSQIITECPNLKSLVLDNNPVKAENWHLLIKEESPVQHLSLRYNDITEKGAELLGMALGTTNQQNQKLLSLNLNGNHIGDKGAEFLAKGLRMNRTLLSLGLTHNQIGDDGTQKLAEVLSRFPLTHEEVVERRKLMSSAPDRKSNERKNRRSRKRLDRSVSIHSASTSVASIRGKSQGEIVSDKTTSDQSLKASKGKTLEINSSIAEVVDPPPGSKRSDSRDRPGSVRSTHAGQGTKGKSAKAKKDVKGGKEDEKHDKTKGKKQDEKPAKKETRGGRASVVADSTKGGTKKGHEKGKGKKGAAPLEQENADMNEVLNPLLDMIEPLKDGVLMLKGNMNLISLNLSYNQLGPEAIKALQKAVGYQTTISALKGSKPGNTGLMRLCLQRNNVAPSNDDLQTLNELMHTKDPFYKPTVKSPEQES